MSFIKLTSKQSPVKFVLGTNANDSDSDCNDKTFCNGQCGYRMITIYMYLIEFV